MMGPALPPGAVGQEMLACGLLGGVLGAARAVLPTRGRAAFLPDLLFVGCVLMALQGYAVSQRPVRLAARCIAPWKAVRAAAKVRRNEKRLAKKPKKSLPTPPRMLYNSNVSK